MDPLFYEFKEWYDKKYEQIKQEAIKNGTWQPLGFDSNTALFKPLNEELKEKLKSLHKETPNL